MKTSMPMRFLHKACLSMDTPTEVAARDDCFEKLNSFNHTRVYGNEEWHNEIHRN